MYESDVVLACGVRFDDRATGIIRKFCPDAKIIHIDIDAAEVNKILPAYHAIIGDAESVLPFLAQAIAEFKGAPAAAVRTRAKWLARLKALKAEQSGLDSTAIHKSPGAGRSSRNGDVNPGAFIASIPEKARSAGLDPDNIIVTTDVGQHQMWAAQNYPVRFPRQFLTSGSLGTMGFGLPAAIGAALANPGKRVVCFSGDGSIMMNVQELATLAELDLDVTVIVLDNGVLGMVRQQQELLFDRNFSACIFGRSPDLVRIAEGFGIAALDADEQNWERIAFGGKGPRFVRCRIAAEENVYPFVPAGRPNIEAMTGEEINQ